MDPENLFLRFDEWSGKIQRNLDDYLASIKAINALMIVATFIAGVQATLIPLTTNLSKSNLARASNFIGFLGLVLDISGTFLGALDTLFLQRKVAYVSNIINNMAETKRDLGMVIKAIKQQELERANLAPLQRFPPAQELVSASEPISELGDIEQVPEPEEGSDSEKKLDSGDDLDHSKFESRRSHGTGTDREGFFNAEHIVITGGTFNQVNHHVVGSIKEPDDLEERAMNVRNILDRMDSDHHDLAPPFLIDKIYELLEKVLVRERGANMISARHNTVITIGLVKPAVRFMVPYGNIPSISMAGGVACLALSTILLAAASQSDVLGPEVWITCLLTVVGVATLSLFPNSSFEIYSRLRKGWRNQVWHIRK